VEHVGSWLIFFFEIRPVPIVFPLQKGPGTGVKLGDWETYSITAPWLSWFAATKVVSLLPPSSQEVRLAHSVSCAWRQIWCSAVDAVDAVASLLLLLLLASSLTWNASIHMPISPWVMS